MRITPSILNADFANLAGEIARIPDADAVHVDVMDNHFVPNLTIGLPVVESIRRATDQMLDIHLMIADPDRYLKDFIDAGADWVTVHVETCVHLHRTLACIKDMGRKAGAVLNPATSLTTLEYVLAEVDLVMLMSVNPGFGGQSFIPSAIDKIRRLRQMLDAVNPGAGIEVDGGIGPATIGAVAEAGANIFVAGSAIYGQAEYGPVIRDLRQRAVR